MAEAGSVGNVDEAQQMMKQVETMRAEREVIKTEIAEKPEEKILVVSHYVSRCWIYLVKSVSKEWGNLIAVSFSFPIEPLRGATEFCNSRR